MKSYPPPHHRTKTFLSAFTPTTGPECLSSTSVFHLMNRGTFMGAPYFWKMLEISPSLAAGRQAAAGLWLSFGPASQGLVATRAALVEPLCIPCFVLSSSFAMGRNPGLKPPLQFPTHPSNDDKALCRHY